MENDRNISVDLFWLTLVPSTPPLPADKLVMFLCFVDSFTSEIIANPVVPGRKEGRRQFFHCRICFKTLSTARLAMRHELVHSGIRPFKCSYCNKTYAREECRVRHERTHTGVKLYKCDRCSESFTWYNTLRRHKDKCRGERFRLKVSLKALQWLLW